MVGRQIRHRRYRRDRRMACQLGVVMFHRSAPHAVKLLERPLPDALKAGSASSAPTGLSSSSVSSARQSLAAGVRIARFTSRAAGFPSSPSLLSTAPPALVRHQVLVHDDPVRRPKRLPTPDLRDLQHSPATHSQERLRQIFMVGTRSRIRGVRALSRIFRGRWTRRRIPIRTPPRAMTLRRHSTDRPRVPGRGPQTLRSEPPDGHAAH